MVVLWVLLPCCLSNLLLLLLSAALGFSVAPEGAGLSEVQRDSWVLARLEAVMEAGGGAFEGPATVGPPE